MGNLCATCVGACCGSACAMCCKDAPPCVGASFGLLLSITILVLGILGATSVIQVEPAAAYLGLILPGIVLSIMSCVICCKGKSR